MKTSLNLPENRRIKIKCLTCCIDTNHQILCSANINNIGETDYWVADDYQILQCLGCESICFRHEHETFDDDHIEVSPGNYQTMNLVSVYPNTESKRNFINERDALPHRILRIYEETLKALNENQNILCGIGIRAILETICKDRNAQGADLYKKIDDLLNQQVLTIDGASILHKLRTLGNAAAHEVKPHSIRQLNVAIDVIEHLLEDIYILPDRIKEVFK